jgi:hypothetical protein
VSKTLKPYVYCLVFLLVSACSGFSGDWPNLAEPIPGPEARERVTERAQPVRPVIDPVSEQRESPLGRSAAFKLLESTRARLEKATLTYQKVKDALISTTGDDKTDLWNEAQLMLTRQSHTASRLDSILQSKALQGAPVMATAMLLKNQQDAFLVSERKALAALKP